MNSTDTSETISLLWPPGIDETDRSRHGTWSEHALIDLGVDRVATAICPDPQQAKRTQGLLTTLCQDPRVITYRQMILGDLLAMPDLMAGLAELQPLLADLSSYRVGSTARGVRLNQLAWRLGQLDLYVTCVQKLTVLLTEPSMGLQAEGLHHLRSLVQRISRDETFQLLAQELPEMLTQMRQASSVTIGVNLNSRLQPEGATLLAINDHKFEGQSFLNRLFGRKTADHGLQGITPLYAKSPSSTDVGIRELLKDLDQILSDTAKTIAGKLDRYTRLETGVFANLAFELVFYLGAAGLIRKLQERGLPMCCPDVLPQADRAGELQDFYDLNLALRLSHKSDTPNLQTEIVTNHAIFVDAGRIFILTGPNQGGKTTYIQGIGLAQVLFQTGLYVPGTAARLSPVDGIFTHFPAEEKPGLEAGRFGEEARRLQKIFQQATRHSLLLLNESLTSTSEGESLYLAQDLVRAMRMLGVRAIFATHLHSLAEQVEAINAETAGDSRLISMVAGMQPAGDNGPAGVKRTYKIEPGPPLGNSYARDIAARYGISLDQIIEVLTARQVLPDSGE